MPPHSLRHNPLVPPRFKTPLPTLYVPAIATQFGLNWIRSAVSMSKHKILRRFAPLKPGAKNDHDAPKLKGIIFDVDGTLW